MTRSAARRGDPVQTGKSPPSISDSPPDDAHAVPAPSAGVPWYWRFALFLWGTSYAFLILYEWLAGLIKAW
jgi:hypothetical protein